LLAGGEKPFQREQTHQELIVNLARPETGLFHALAKGGRVQAAVARVPSVAQHC